MVTRCLLILSLLTVAGLAHADVISMSEESCLEAEQGAACEGEEGAGTCQPDTCCRLDYSQGTPPTEQCNDCLTCQRAASSDDDGCDAGAASGPIGLGALAFGLLLAVGLRRRNRAGRGPREAS